MKTFLRLISFLKPSWRWLLISVLLGTLTIVSGIALLATSAWLISTAALHPSIAVLQVSIVGVRFFGLTRGFFRYLERLASHETTFRLLSRIRTWFYSSLEPLLPSGLGTQRSGDLLSSFLGDIATLEDFCLRILAPPLVAVVVLLAMGLFMAGIDPFLSLLLLLALLSVGFGLSILVFTFGRKPGRQIVSTRAEMTAELVETLQGLPDLLLFDAISSRLDRMKTSQTALFKAQRKMSLSSAIQSNLEVLFSGIGVWLVLIIGIGLVVAGRFPGTFLAVIVLASMASFEAVQALPQAAGHLESSLQAARRLFAVADRSPLVSDAPSVKTKISDFHLKLDGLSFSYPGTDPASFTLSAIDLDLPPGKHIAILSPSGNGKSTLLHLLMRFWDVSPGMITLGSQDVHTYAQETVRNCFSFLPQEIYLFHASLRENLLVADPHADDDHLLNTIKIACLDEYVNSAPLGLDTLVAERGLTMSGGESQRLGLARMLLKEAPIYLLDEPTAHLDARLERQVIRNLQSALREKSVIWVTQRLIGLDWFDQILVFQHGRIVQSGSHTDLLSQSGLYQMMVKAQQFPYPLHDSQ